MIIIKEKRGYEGFSEATPPHIKKMGSFVVDYFGIKAIYDINQNNLEKGRIQCKAKDAKTTAHRLKDKVRMIFMEAQRKAGIIPENKVVMGDDAFNFIPDVSW